jgi:multisubunit Na+/H+ antiporter MnhG subunit
MSRVLPTLELTLWDRFIFALSLVLTLVAAFTRLREGRSGMFREFRWLHNAIGGLALCYGVGYALVLLGVVDRLEWSKFFTGVSLFAWLLVWIYPPVLARRVAKSIGKHLAETEG